MNNELRQRIGKVLAEYAKEQEGAGIAPHNVMCDITATVMAMAGSLLGGTVGKEHVMEAVEAVLPTILQYAIAGAITRDECLSEVEATEAIKQAAQT